jgi:type VI secretion system secreted protein VgrG
VEIAGVGDQSAQPVFLDGSGRRRGWVKLFGIFVGTGLAATLAVLVLGITGASPFGIPGLPELGRAEVESSATPVPQPNATAAPTNTVVVQQHLPVATTTTRTTAPANKPTTPPPTTTQPPPPTATPTPPPASDSPTTPPSSP